MKSNKTAYLIGAAFAICVFGTGCTSGHLPPSSDSKGRATIITEIPYATPTLSEARSTSQSLTQTTHAVETAMSLRREEARQTNVALGPTTPEPIPTPDPDAIPANAVRLAGGLLFFAVSSHTSATEWVNLWRIEQPEHILTVRAGGLRKKNFDELYIPMQGVIEVHLRLPPLEPGWPTRPFPGGGQYYTPNQGGAAHIVDVIRVEDRITVLVATEDGTRYLFSVNDRVFYPAENKASLNQR